MKIQSVQSLAAGESQRYSADNNDAEIINLDDSSDEIEVDVTDSVWIPLSSEHKSGEGLDSSDQVLDVESVPSTGNRNVERSDEYSRDEGSTSDTPPESPESVNNEQLTDCPASPESVNEPTENPNNIATGQPSESPACPDISENVEVLDSPESPEPASSCPKILVSAVKVRTEGDSEDRSAMPFTNPEPILSITRAEGHSYSGLEYRLAQLDEDWEADSEPNPPFPENNNKLDYAGILALRASNKADVDSSRSGSSGQATDIALYDNNRESETGANPPLPTLIISSCFPGSTAVKYKWQNLRKGMGSNSGCYNCEGDHKCSECPLPLNRAVIKKRRQESKRNQNQRYFKTDVPPPSKHAQFIPGKISSQLRSAMDIRRNELPDFIYKMRIHGYPPGYLQQAAESASCKKNGGDSARQPQPHGEQWSLIRNGLKKYPGFTSPAPKGIIDDGSRFNAPFTTNYTLDNVARNYVNSNFGEPKVTTTEIACLPKKPVPTASQFSNSCLGYDRPTPFFNPLPVQNTMDRVVKIYHDLVTGKNVSPSRDIVAEVEQTGNYCYKISENLQKLDNCRKNQEAKKKIELIAPSPTKRKKRCRSPSLLDPFPDSEDSLDVNLSQTSVAGNKGPTAATSTVTSPDEDDCKIIGVEPKTPKPPLATIVIDSDDEAQTNGSDPVFLPNPVYKKPKLMSGVSKHLESEKSASTARNKEWGDFLAEFTISPENYARQNSKVGENQFLEVNTPEKKNYSRNRWSTVGLFSVGSQPKPVGRRNEPERVLKNKLDFLPKHGINISKSNLYNGSLPTDNSSRDKCRSQSTVVERCGQLHLDRQDAAERKKMNEVAAKNTFHDDEDDIQIIE